MGRWLRAAGLLAAALLSTSCNALLGIHELPGDASTGSDGGCPGICQCVVDTDCTGDHTACYSDGTNRLCQCAPGYALASEGSGSDGSGSGPSSVDAGIPLPGDAGTSDAGTSGSACVWTGVVADPAVDDPTAWTLLLGATIDPSVDATGQLDPGAAEMQLCNQNGAQVQDGYITQSVAMPRRSRAQSLVLLANINGGQSFESQLQLGVQLGNAFTQQFFDGFESQWEQTRTCIGAGNFQPEDATGPSRAIDVSAGILFVDEFDPFCDQSTPAAIDHLEVVPANPGECPDPGTVTNGSCDGSGGWTFEFSGNSGDSAAIQPSVGDQASSAVELTVGENCDFAEAQTPMEIPVQDGSATAALSIYHSSTQTGFSASVGGVQLGLAGSQPTIDRFCVPAAMRGEVTSIDVELTQSVSGLACGSGVFAQAIVDDVALSNDPLCGSDPYVADPGFESGLSTMGLYPQSGATAAVVADSMAHGGAHDLQLSVAQVCGNSYYEIPVAGPAITDTTGPALTFWYRYPPGGNTSMYVSNDSSFVPIRDGQWHQEHQCMSTAAFGQPPQFFVEIESTTSGTCGSAQSAETVSLDDLEIASDPTCVPTGSNRAAR